MYQGLIDKYVCCFIFSLPASWHRIGISQRPTLVPCAWTFTHSLTCTHARKGVESVREGRTHIRFLATATKNISSFSTPVSSRS